MIQRFSRTGFTAIIDRVKLPIETFAKIAPAKKLPKKSGFGKNPPLVVEYQVYNLELKKRFLSDDSELLIGSALVQVPKTLKDLTGETLTNREVWDAFARASCFCLITSEAIAQKNVNQIWLFDNSWKLMDRIETNAWKEKDWEPSYKQPMGKNQADLAWEAFKRCKVEVNWLSTPVIA